ncbi:hypothetical protein JNW90_13700 [Micromonospora sp. STR1s_5]|nr:hypothetical protein [Micromonospora sp. STR1s_5]
MYNYLANAMPWSQGSLGMGMQGIQGQGNPSAIASAVPMGGMPSLASVANSQGGMPRSAPIATPSTYHSQTPGFAGASGQQMAAPFRPTPTGGGAPMPQGGQQQQGSSGIQQLQQMSKQVQQMLDQQRKSGKMGQPPMPTAGPTQLSPSSPVPGSATPGLQQGQTPALSGSNQNPAGQMNAVTPGASGAADPFAPQPQNQTPNMGPAQNMMTPPPLPPVRPEGLLGGMDDPSLSPQGPAQAQQPDLSAMQMQMPQMDLSNMNNPMMMPFGLLGGF